MDREGDRMGRQGRGVCTLGSEAEVNMRDDGNDPPAAIVPPTLEIPRQKRE